VIECRAARVTVTGAEVHLQAGVPPAKLGELAFTPRQAG
jgi:hypothetical protein